MKLANKYELFDPLTTGRVETFVARVLAGGERVLVYVFESGPSPFDPPAIEWALEAFRGMAPGPPGEVVDVGRYGETGFTYLVTKVPEAEALQKWTLAYEAFVPSALEVQAPPASASSKPFQSGTRPSVPEPGSATSAFLSAPPAAEASPVAPKPKDTKSVPAPAPVPDRVPTRPKESFTGMFQSASVPAETGNAGLRSDEGKAGDFTSFFRGPFTGKAPAEIPNVAPPAPEPKNRAGEFTAIFGGGRQHPQEPVNEPSRGGGGQLNEPGGFTQLFAAPASGQNPAAYETPNFMEEKPVKAENPFVFDKPTWEPQIPTQPPVPPKSPFESMPAVLPRLPKGGPSEYTMIVSGGMRSSALPDEPPIAGGSNSPGASSPAAFAMPKVPAIPPVPKMPAAPPIPHLPAAPPMPAVAAPKAPALPEVPKPPMSYLPLILAMTVLFFVGAMLVLYFALKH